MDCLFYTASDRRWADVDLRLPSGCPIPLRVIGESGVGILASAVRTGQMQAVGTLIIPRSGQFFVHDYPNHHFHGVTLRPLRIITHVMQKHTVTSVCVPS